MTEDERASYWMIDRLTDEEVLVPIGNHVLRISVCSEAPMNAKDQRVSRRGNRYYPTLIDFEELTMHADTARELAMRLLEAAAVAELTDAPDVDVCGHWWPCDCG